MTCVFHRMPRDLLEKKQLIIFVLDALRSSCSKICKEAENLFSLRNFDGSEQGAAFLLAVCFRCRSLSTYGNGFQVLIHTSILFRSSERSS
jgi:hypothetical protein